MTKKVFAEVVVVCNVAVKDDLLWLRLVRTDGANMPPMLPGQFIELQVPASKALLNRPVSVFNCTANVLELLVKVVGTTTRTLREVRRGETLRIVAPLGRGFTVGDAAPLLVGGGVGVAPMYFLARAYADKGVRPTLIYGERTAPADAVVARLAEVSDVHICTDDGTAGFHGLVTAHPAFAAAGAALIQCCGPLPMMRAVAAAAKASGTECEVSLENRMACGLGACLCCVEDTNSGRKCVCTHGPVFNTRELPW